MAVFVYCVRLARGGGRKVNLIMSEIVIDGNGDVGWPHWEESYSEVSLQICVVGTFLLFGLWDFFMCLIVSRR